MRMRDRMKARIHRKFLWIFIDLGGFSLQKSMKNQLKPPKSMKIHKMPYFSEKKTKSRNLIFFHTFYNHPRSIEGACAFWKVGRHQTAFELALRSLTTGNID